MTDSTTEAESTDSAHGDSARAQTSAETSGPDPRPQPAAGAPAVAEAAGSAAEPVGPPPSGESGPARPERGQQSLLEQMGGVVGLVTSTIPVVVFILVNALTSLQPAIWAALSAAVLIAAWRLWRKEPIQPAISGVLGVAACAFIAYRTGSAKGFFLFGIWTSLLYGAVFLISAVVRWPLAGVAWSVLNGSGFGWRQDRRVLFGYDLATVCWSAVFLARFVVQHWLYNTDQTGWLAVARIGMGYPLTAFALGVTVWAIRRERAHAKQAELAADATA